jgi:hypothetical protein
MSRCLLVVERSFVVKGYLALIPGISPEGEERFRIGDPILLKKPDRSTVSVQIGSLELLNPNPRHEVTILLKDMAKEDVPVGTEVWSVEHV